MDPVIDLSVNIEIETPSQEPSKTYTRTSRCGALHNCSLCSTPSAHVRNLDDAINNSNERQPTSPTSTTVKDQPHQPPPRHLVLNVYSVFHDAIEKNDFAELFDMFQEDMHYDHLEELIHLFKDALQCHDFAEMTYIT